MSKRSKDFSAFSVITLMHVDNYTVKQYGDAPSDPVEGWTPEQCLKAIEKYCTRYPGQRGRTETLRDMLKIAHFAALVFWKLKPTGEEIMKLEKGEF